jgi:hypothetical protein
MEAVMPRPEGMQAGRGRVRRGRVTLKRSAKGARKYVLPDYRQMALKFPEPEEGRPNSRLREEGLAA